jgi:hypothetical protein
VSQMFTDRLGTFTISSPSVTISFAGRKYISDGARTSACSSTQDRFNGQIPVALKPEIQLAGDAPVTHAR